MNSNNSHRALAWTSLIDHSLEICWVQRTGSAWLFNGAATMIEGLQPFGLDYHLSVDGGSGRTRFDGRIRTDCETPRTVEITGNHGGSWKLHGGDDDAPFRVDGAACIDLGWTPLTNTFSIWRLDLAVGDSAEITNAWVPFPDFVLKPSVQRYTRLGRNRYRYEQPAIDFSADLDVDDEGFVLRYGDIWAAVPVQATQQPDPYPIAGGTP